jgi:hypothetical protein
MRKSTRLVEKAPTAVWEWADSIPDLDPPPKPKSDLVIQHTAAKRGKQVFRVGDIVQLVGETAYKWIGIVRSFEMDYYYEREEWMRVVVLWFNRQQDVLNAKRRKDAHAVHWKRNEG